MCFVQISSAHPIALHVGDAAKAYTMSLEPESGLTPLVVQIVVMVAMENHFHPHGLCKTIYLLESVWVARRCFMGDQDIRLLFSQSLVSIWKNC